MKRFVAITVLAVAGLLRTAGAGAQSPAAPQTDLRESGSATLVALYDSSKSAETKETILRYLAEIDDAQARQKLLTVAKGDADPELREAAIRRLAERGQTPLLVELYDAEKDADVKETILRRLGERDDDAARKKVLAVAKTEADTNVRERAIRLLAERGHTTLLLELYDAEKDTDVKEMILKRLAERGDEAARKKLFAVARDESNPDLQEAAIRAIARMAAAR